MVTYEPGWPKPLEMSHGNFATDTRDSDPIHRTACSRCRALSTPVSVSIPSDCELTVSVEYSRLRDPNSDSQSVVRIASITIHAASRTPGCATASRSTRVASRFHVQANSRTPGHVATSRPSPRSTRVASILQVCDRMAPTRVGSGSCNLSMDSSTHAEHHCQAP